MFICSCKAVTDRTIAATLAAGAQTTEDVGRMCEAGTRCGGCLPIIEQMLRDAALYRPSRLSTPA